MLIRKRAPTSDLEPDPHLPRPRVWQGASPLGALPSWTPEGDTSSGFHSNPRFTDFLNAYAGRKLEDYLVSNHLGFGAKICQGHRLLKSQTHGERVQGRTLSLPGAKPACLSLRGSYCKTCDHFNLGWAGLFGGPNRSCHWWPTLRPLLQGQCNDCFELRSAKDMPHGQEVPETLRCLGSHHLPLPIPTGTGGEKPGTAQALPHTVLQSLAQV